MLDPNTDTAAGSWDAPSWPAAAVARRLLISCGLPDPGSNVPAWAPTSPAEDWDATGLGEARDAIVGAPGTLAQGISLAFQVATGVTIAGPQMLGDRAASIGLTAHGRIARGGATRLMPCLDGWWSLNLARDLDLVPALVEDDTVVEDDPWGAVSRWSSCRSAADIIERCRLLGLAAAALGETAPSDPPWTVRHATAPHTTNSRRDDRPLVVNLGALWAAPLAAQLLFRTGCRVIHVESLSRPDHGRTAWPQFSARLHAGTELRRMDFTRPQELALLLERADIVIEASRARALVDLGVDADTINQDGLPRTWLRITGHDDPHRVAFGDDAAVAGGLVAMDDSGPVFVGDAIADPLTGLVAALAVVGHRAASTTPRQTTLDVTLAGVSAYAASL